MASIQGDYQQWARMTSSKNLTAKHADSRKVLIVDDNLLETIAIKGILDSYGIQSDFA